MGVKEEKWDSMMLLTMHSGCEGLERRDEENLEMMVGVTLEWSSFSYVCEKRLYGSEAGLGEDEGVE